MMVVVGYAEGGLEFSTDDGSGPAGDQQTAASMAGAMNGGAYPSFPTSYRPDRPEKYSRKVFVGGLPPDIDEGMICLHPVDEKS